MSDEPRPIPPDHLVAGRYRIEYRVGAGGGGEVYRSVDQKLDRTLALKRMLGGDVEERLQQAVDEARILARLASPNIPTVFDLIADQGELWLICSFVEGKSLYRILREGERWSLTSVLKLTRDLADILRFAHGKRVAHSDIKPSNILVGDDRRITLTDFGVARVVSLERLRPGPAVLKGTEGYLAPEIYDADPKRLELKQCVRWDVYALGVVLFNMLVLDMPSSVNPDKVNEQVTEGLRVSLALEPEWDDAKPPVVPDELRDAVMSLLSRALDPEPKNRIESADAFIQGLDEISAIHARLRAAVKPARRVPWLAIVTTVLALAAGVAIGRFAPLP